VKTAETLQVNATRRLKRTATGRLSSSDAGAEQFGYPRRGADRRPALIYWRDAIAEPVEIVSPPFTSASTIKESWIPKSAANVAQTDKPEVPAGFRQVPPSPEFN
jgi:hypothetical protein